jgi:hypothetical protein
MSFTVPVNTGLWKVYFLSRAENGMPASKHYKVLASSAASAFSHAILLTEKRYNVNLIEIEQGHATVITKEQWDTEDGYEKI